MILKRKWIKTKEINDLIKLARVNSNPKNATGIDINDGMGWKLKLKLKNCQ
jgi:hypothetical protein